MTCRTKLRLQRISRRELGWAAAGGGAGGRRTASSLAQGDPRHRAGFRCGGCAREAAAHAENDGGHALPLNKSKRDAREKHTCDTKDRHDGIEATPLLPGAGATWAPCSSSFRHALSYPCRAARCSGVSKVFVRAFGSPRAASSSSSASTLDTVCAVPR